jgi:hypothetical protein
MLEIALGSLEHLESVGANTKDLLLSGALRLEVTEIKYIYSEYRVSA